MLRLYPDEAKDKEYRQTAQIVEELKRRQKKGTFGKRSPEKWPDGFDRWDAQKKTAYLIDALEEVDARQWGQPGGVDLVSDRRVAELIRLGNQAVPSLIDALENDERLTRSVHFWRNFARFRTVLGVREAVLTALMSILRVQAFKPVATGDNFTARGDDAAKKMAQRLRTYWKEYGQLPFDERMMKVLVDPKADFEARREAARNLATLNDDGHLQTTMNSTGISAEALRKPNPAVAKFSKPTVAEAILSAMMADLQAHDAKTPSKYPDLDDYRRHRLEGTYLSALVALGDQRIAPELAKRAAEAKAALPRCQWAEIAHSLGDPKPFRSFAEDFRAGKIEVPSRQDHVSELENILAALIRVGTPEAKRASRRSRRSETSAVPGRRPTGPHPKDKRRPPPGTLVCPPVLSVDPAHGARRYVADGGQVHHRERHALPKEPKWRRPRRPCARVPGRPHQPPRGGGGTYLRRCRGEAGRVGRWPAALSSFVPGCGPAVDGVQDRLRSLRRKISQGGPGRACQPWPFRLDAGLPPGPAPLDHVATAEDVKAGKAVFHLDGKGKLTDLKLPAVGLLIPDDKKKRWSTVLIVQAEVSADGQVTYGVIMKEDVRAVPGGELTNIKTLPLPKVSRRRP